MGTKKISIIRIVLITFAALFIAVFLIPMPYSLTDGGSTGVCSLFGWGYDVRKCHELSGARDIDGVSFSCSPSTTSYNVGTRVKIFGLVVFDNTHLDPPLSELDYEDEIKDLIAYYNSHRVEDVELRSISVYQRDAFDRVYLNFSDATKIEVIDEIVKVIKDYLDEHPESFLYDHDELIIGSRHNEVIEKTMSSATFEIYEVEYCLSLPDKSITELQMTSNMIPESVPSGHIFQDVQTIRFYYYDSLTDDESKVLGSIYPNAEIVHD